ncbi:Protein N-acetyltransferase, RimJ/RimL family [Algoriella xinjiangensis]|uniref:Protein N-acetyltransferase, RimJ/RimL family n=1 Tax=Algoriella xinjiangensis TaxID=684065 RepID=A0A1I4XG00_9FLAO|nr:GNAT family N-acetyltransferase [Algoriella xinjiangensis]SFN24838.1 Protein N-acetyltransferase, RimJ/RimL family [Algoriella xinjiangensis]VDH17627.1 anhydro-N-acetylmuramic acid kinase [Algoriella xinjiangensis]
MKYLPILETERLIIRPISMDDLDGLFEMDSQPEVHIYLKNEPIKTIDQTKKIIEDLVIQYEKLGHGRLAVIEKESGNFIGWTGFKYIEEKDKINNKIDFLDFGYRYKKEVWGKGYATEAAKACIDFYNQNMKEIKLNALTHIDNIASRKVLEKVGFQVTETFHFDLWNLDCYWYEFK